MTAAALVVVILAALSASACGVRFLRVAQREHYLPGAPSRFFMRWWRCRRAGPPLLVAALAGAGASVEVVLVGLVGLAVAGLGPPGLSLRGRSAPLSWTRRLWLLATVSASAEVALVAGVWAAIDVSAAASAAVWCALFTPFVIDTALVVVAAPERRAAQRYVDDASARLATVRPRVVAITGSYGKTSTKQHVAELLSGRFEVLASPRSYNNRAGLARTVNMLLRPGTEILVAEMGTYGPGEIAELCAWMTPEVAVITAIGPVHLERFGSLDVTLRAKAEICERARVVVLNTDDERLAGLADEISSRDVRLWRCSASDEDADVAVVAGVSGLRLWSRGRDLGPLGVDEDVLVAPSNLACAIAVALSFECSIEEVVARAASLRPVDNRLALARTDDGVTILDDTYNANPAGAERALVELARAGAPASRRVVVTPGMIELGACQREENARLAERAVLVASDLVVVGRTNRSALLAGAKDGAAGGAAVHMVSTRAAAVAWVRAHCRAGDAVLYENDLPDHYP